MLNNKGNSEYCESNNSALLMYTESINDNDDPSVLLNRLADHIRRIGLADKCMILMEELPYKQVHAITSFGFTSADLKAATRHITGQIQALPGTTESKRNTVLVKRDKNNKYALASFIYGGQSYRVLALIYRSETLSEYTKTDINSMSVLLNILRISLANTDLQDKNKLDQKKILKAKQEWEYSIDKLQDLICLLDEKGRVVRANRTLERWGLGDVQSVTGLTLHEILHPDCRNRNCDVSIAWEDMWKRSEHSKFEICELYDQNLDGNIRLSIRRNMDAVETNHIVLVIENISEMNWDRQLMEVYTEELYAQIQSQSLQLAHANAALTDEVHEHHQNKKSLRKTEARLQSLSAKLLTAQEEERKRIAAELHDGIGQSISAIKFTFENQLMPSKDGISSPCQGHQQQAIIARLQSAVEEVRRISMGLRPAMLDDLGLLPTLMWFFREFQNTFEGLTLRVLLGFGEKDVPGVRKLMVFRIIQEGLNNITKHAEADTATVELTKIKGQLILIINDDGKGFSFTDKKVATGFGLASMKERAKISGGGLAIDSKSGKGTTIKAIWNE